MTYQLPQLGFSYDALEPLIDARTMQVHLEGHHKAYVDNLNQALLKTPQLQNISLEELLAAPDNVPLDVRDEIQNNGGGHYNHSLFWQILTPRQGEIGATLQSAIISQFGSVENFKRLFTATATRHFGSGYAWFCLNNQGRFSVMSLPNQETPLRLGCEPLLILDLWEHAYYLKYQNHRPEFVEAFWNVVDWRMVENLYVHALYKKHKQIPSEARH